MKQFALITITLLQIYYSAPTLASENGCGRENFSNEELNDPYGPESKILEKHSTAESAIIVESIVKNAGTEANKGGRSQCLENTVSCFGIDQNWHYSSEKIFDYFGNLLRVNGRINSKHFVDYPAERYYAHRAEVSYLCSWGGSLQPQCVKLCTLSVIDDRWHD